jgi:hypothetical protein
MILSKEAQERASLILAQLVVFRRSLREASEDDIARKLGFDHAADLHAQLRVWELPEWLVSGDRVSEKPKAPRPAPRKPKARTLGPAKELPPAGNATELFKERLEALLESTEQLKHMDERLHGRHFARQDVETVAALFPWEHLSEEGREALRRQHGPDFDEDFFDPSTPFIRPGGVALSPAETETILIAVYALAGGDMDALLDALHPDSPSVKAETRERVRLWVEGAKTNNDPRDGLKALARQLAIWVRGSEVRTGRPSGRSRADHAAACAITEYRQRGLTEEEIAHKFAHPLLHKKEDGTSYTIKEITELGDLGLSWP